ncbi:MAG: fructose-1,6-bisphosphatase class I [Chloroflexi bacterium OLB15]|nr:MAG: fructose-1,6-bisphosphatase class I [Chloroflexi bacterium OLB15]
MSSHIITIERHILEKQRQYPDASGVFTSMLYDIALAAKLIARETTRAGLANILGATEGINVYGERQQKLDVFADSIIFKMNDYTRRLCAMASEEHEDIIEIPPHFGTGKYVLLYDPLDGSSNIDVNVSVGTIFAIHRKISLGERGTMQDVLQPGWRLAAAGYVIYGSSTMLVYTTGQGVHGFTLDPTLGEFLLSHENIRIPETPKFYSVNHGNEKYWTEGVRRYTRWLQGMDEGDNRPPLSHRYIGSLVTDFHRNLLQGGVFYYPGDLRDPDNPYGKMRLMFEAQALAFIAQHAGGYASDGAGDVLDVQPHHLHQHTPVIVGNRELVEKAEDFIRRYDAEWLNGFQQFRGIQPEFEKRVE